MLRTGRRGRSENIGKGQRSGGKRGLRVMEDQGAADVASCVLGPMQAG